MWYHTSFLLYTTVAPHGDKACKYQRDRCIRLLSDETAVDIGHFQPFHTLYGLLETIREYGRTVYYRYGSLYRVGAMETDEDGHLPVCCPLARTMFRGKKMYFLWRPKYINSHSQTATGAVTCTDFRESFIHRRQTFLSCIVRELTWLYRAFHDLHECPSNIVFIFLLTWLYSQSVSVHEYKRLKPRICRK
jgi:hypothetical protein